MILRVFSLIFFLQIFFVNCQVRFGEIYSIETKIPITKSAIEENNQILLNQKPLNKYLDSVHIKVFFNEQNISLIRKKNGNSYGYIFNKITQYNYHKKDRNKLKNTFLFYQILELNVQQVEKTINKLLETKQIQVPTDSLIPNWNSNYLHCNSVQFQFKIGKEIKNQNYDCPWNQEISNDSIFTIVENEKYLRKELKLDSLYSEFKNKLPKGKTYSSDGYRMMYIMTQNQHDSWIKSKPNREYLKSVKDTIDNYLKSLVKPTNIKSEKINCFENYDLIFSPKGKLISVKVSQYEKPKLKNSLGIQDYFNDVREIRTCKKKIKKLFKNSNFSFVNLQYSIRRSISFNLEGNAEIYDNTMY